MHTSEHVVAENDAARRQQDVFPHAKVTSPAGPVHRRVIQAFQSKCPVVRCRKHSSHSVFSVHKTMCKFCHAVLPFPIFSPVILCSLCLCVLYVDLQMICI